MDMNGKGSNSGTDRDPQTASLQADVRKSERLGEFLTSLPKWVTYAVIVWQAGLSITVMASPNSLASLLTRFGRQASYWEVICWAAGILGVLFGLYNRRLLSRQSTLDSARLAEVERRLNVAAASPVSRSTGH